MARPGTRSWNVLNGGPAQRVCGAPPPVSPWSPSPLPLARFGPLLCSPLSTSKGFVGPLLLLLLRHLAHLLRQKKKQERVCSCWCCNSRSQLAGRPRPRRGRRPSRRRPPDGRQSSRGLCRAHLSAMRGMTSRACMQVAASASRRAMHATQRDTEEQATGE